MKQLFIVTIMALVFSALPVRAATYNFTDFYGKLKADEYYGVEVEIGYEFANEAYVVPPGQGVTSQHMRIYGVTYYNATGVRSVGNCFQTISPGSALSVAGSVISSYSTSFPVTSILNSIDPALNFPISSYSPGIGFTIGTPTFTYQVHPSGVGVGLPSSLFADADVISTLKITYKGNVFNVTNKQFSMRYQGWLDEAQPLTYPLTVDNNPNFTGRRILIYRFSLKIPNEKGITRFLNPFDSCICGALCQHCCTCGWWDDVTDNERTGRVHHSCAEKHPSKCDHVRGDASGLLPGKTYCPYCCPCHAEDDDGDPDDPDDGDGDPDDPDGEEHAKHVVIDNVGSFHGPGLPNLTELDLEVIDHFTPYDDTNYTFTYLTKTGDFSFTLDFVTLADRLTAAFGGVLPVNFAFDIYNVTKNSAGISSIALPLVLQFDYTIFEGTPYAVHFATPPFDLGSYFADAAQLPIVPVIRQLVLALVVIYFMFNVFSLFFMI